jgi:nitrite reductase/ring-hydroxylating ferredoxin subunit/uncharacterized membrane protein
MPSFKDVLEGKPFRCPLHPALVHLPIALFPLSVILDVASHVPHRADVPLVTAAFIALLSGLATALLAAVFGIVDYTEIRDDHPAKKTATAHLILNLIAVGLFAVSAGLRFSALDVPATGALPLLISLVGLAVLSYSGYLGGVLVYDDGIGVGRHRRRTPLPTTTIVVKTDGKPTAIANDADLGEGASLRVSVDGTAATVVRIEGALHAFQEFCPHRYGPLSEGKLSKCEVTCPWHGSRFDVRTGKVTGGPAKLDLLTFRVETRDGKIWIHPPKA